MGVVKNVKAMWRRSVSLGSIVSVVIVVLLLYWGMPWIAGHLLARTAASVPDGLELKDFIIKVKSDLEAADRAAVQQNQAPLLQLQDVELEANFVVQSHAQTDVKLVTVNGSALAGLERSQKIVLHLKPVPRRDVAVSGSQAPIVITPGASEVIHMTPAGSPQH